jgi:hypothetical protein
VNTHSFDISTHVKNIIANRSIKDALMTRLRAQRVPQRISVTDLLNLKIAYFRRKHPEIVPALESQQLMWTGTGFHDIFGSLVSSEEYIEQFVEVEGIAGRIDIFETVPVEVKTTTNLSEDADLRLKRPSYLEQLGIYCSMVDVDKGQVIIYQRDTPSELSAPLIVFNVKFSNLRAIRQEMIRRRNLLQQAITSGDPSKLPKCSWQNFRCDYSGVCDCATSAIPTSYEIVDMVTTITHDEGATQKLLSRLTVQRPSELLRINDVVFPRKAYFSRVQREELKDEDNIVLPDPRETLTSIERQGFLRVLGALLRYGPRGEAQRVPANLAGIRDTIMFYQGVPTIVRATGLRSIVDREQLPLLCSHYFLRLGFECAISNSERGRLVLYYRNIRQEDAKLLIYDVTFRDLDILKAEAERRAALVVRATGCDELPECPSWLCGYCKYRQSCGH